MPVIRVFAPAKINLSLHVIGRRKDGYHLLDSLVVFASVGDEITAKSAPTLTFGIEGAKAGGVPMDESNLVLQAASLFPDPKGAMLLLNKELPASAGIGGGSTDAAATLKALSRLWHTDMPSDSDILKLGADVPVCLKGEATRMRGVGGHLTRVPPLPPIFAVLVNPGVAVPTPAVFAALSDPTNTPMPDQFPRFENTVDFAKWLGTQRNDLEVPASMVAPIIPTVLSELWGCDGCLLARMSGSGATCFGLFSSPEGAERAAAMLRVENPDWWVVDTRLA
jgi:4-diphosphocytidyl-2-C-methyl-D-erythritol kinase